MCCYTLFCAGYIGIRSRIKRQLCEKNFNFLQKLLNNKELDLFDNERAIKIFCESKLDVSVIKRVLFFLEKQEMLELNRNIKNSNINVTLKKDEKFIEPSPVTVKLSSDADDATDEKIFFYCDGIEDLKSLAVFGVEDFVITSCNYLTNEL